MLHGQFVVRVRADHADRDLGEVHHSRPAIDEDQADRVAQTVSKDEGPERSAKSQIEKTGDQADRAVGQPTGGDGASRRHRHGRNRLPGHGGRRGGRQIVAKSPADGYTVLLTIDSTLSINPSLYPKLPYDPVKDFDPVTIIATVPQVLVVHPSVPVNSIAELIAFAKANPTGLNYASPGTGSPQQLLTELFKSLTKTKIVEIPYKGGAQATTDLLSGQVQLLIGSVPTNLPFIRAGKLRALGVTGAKRFPGLPDVPVIVDSVPGYDVNVLFGLLAPAGTPPAVLDKLRTSMIAALNDPATKKRMDEQAFVPVGSSAEVFAKVIRDDRVRWSKVISEAGIKGE